MHNFLRIEDNEILGEEMIRFMANQKGITLIEVVVAELMLMIGVLGLLSLMPSAWRLSGQSDYLGRAAGILQRQLQAAEVAIMNPVLAVTPGTITEDVLFQRGCREPGGRRALHRPDDPHRARGQHLDLAGQGHLAHESDGNFGKSHRFQTGVLPLMRNQKTFATAPMGSPWLRSCLPFS